MSKGAFRRYAWGVVAYNLAVVLWGAYVRVTGSGSGCGDNWPLCGGEFLPHAPGLAKAIEFFHRASSGIDGVLVAGLVIWALLAFPRGHAVRRAAGWAVMFLVTEAVIGAGLVLYHLVENAGTPAGIFAFCLHMANTLLLLGALALTAAWAGSAPRRLDGREWLGAAAVVITAIFGATAALGDTLYPVTSLAAGMTQDFSASAHALIRVRVFHPVLAVATGLYLIWLALRRPAPAAPWLVGAIIAQWTAGLFDWTLLTPMPLQMIHLLLADLVWIAFLLYAATQPTDSATSLPGRSR